MTPDIDALWVYLAATPLLGLTATLLAYLIAYRIYERSGMNPLANPVAIAVALLVALLALTGTPYATYFDGAQFVHFLLGPATVALAVPLYDQRARLVRLAVPLTLGLLAGVVTAIVSAVSIAWALGASRETLLSLAPKSVTTPIAMGIAEKIGGLPSLTAVFVILTGMTGAIIARPLLNALRIGSHAARGFAVGVAAHGIGTARAFQVSEQMGAFAGLAMGLTALITALLAPWLAPLLVQWLAG
ncbi:MAG: LrgB family protein [Burkholderiaceae bacterium]|jgi:predicted murein hydrolase (TIGR00659 family)|nr:LrgB family protein [Burkholderiaceae bacterium]